MIPVMTGDVNQGRKKLDTVQLIPIGFQVARLYAITDYGHQHNTKYNKWTHKVEFTFEFLGWRQKFYEDDTEIKPSVSGRTFTLSMGSKSNLRPFVKSMTGRTLSDKEAQQFNVYTLADKLYLVNVEHSEPKEDGTVYENVGTVVPFDSRMADGVDLTPYNELNLYHIPTHKFDSPEWLNLPFFKRERIMRSQEGIAHEKEGGTFAEPERTDGGTSTAQGPAAPRSNPSTPPPADDLKPKLILLDTSFTREVWNANGWTDELLVQHGKAKWDAPATPPQAPPSAPAPQGPPPPSAMAGNPNLQNLKGDLPDDDLAF